MAKKYKNLEILDFLRKKFNNNKISKLESIEFNINKIYPSQISSNSIILRFDGLSVKIKPIGEGTYQSLKIGYSVQTVKGVCKALNELDNNTIKLNSDIVDFIYTYKPQYSTLEIICSNDKKHQFYCADYNIEMCGGFRAVNDQNLIMEIIE